MEGKCSHHNANPATSFGYLSHMCSIEFQKCFKMDKQKLMPGFDKCAERKKLRSVFFYLPAVLYICCAISRSCLIVASTAQAYSTHLLQIAL